MNKKSKILIGGQALKSLGSDRYTNDFDYLVNDISTKEAFITSEKVDFINANGNKFFAEIFKIEEGRESASPQSLLELKAYSLVQHCQNFNFSKADACEYDMKFLVRKFKLNSINIAKKYISDGEFQEIMKVITSTKI